MSTIVFATETEKADFLRRMRLFAEDIAELSAIIAIPIVLFRRSGDKALIAALNNNPRFWNAVLSGLQTSSHVIIGRIHDKSRDSYLNEIKRFLRTRKEGSEALATLERLEKAHVTLIKRMVNLRQKVFAHADFNRPVYEALGFKEIRADDLEAYWRDLSSAMVRLEQSVFSGVHHPKHKPSSLHEDMRQANEAFDSLDESHGSSVCFLGHCASVILGSFCGG
jgi:AbiU2